jgi:hypothetical protein
MNADDDLTYENSGAAILRFMPELQDVYFKVLNDYPNDSPPESHAMYAEVLTPHIQQLLALSADTDIRLRRAFDLVERLASSADPDVRDIAITAIGEQLDGEPTLAVARRYMGRATRRIFKGLSRISWLPCR